MGLHQPLEIAEGRWERIGVDFITDFPVSQCGNDAVITYVDYFTKRVHWRPCKKTIDAAEFAQRFVDEIERLHGVPKAVVSDRDVRFKGYWEEVTRIMGTSLLKSTAFHPQTDGLAENANKTVVTFLKGFATHRADEWDKLLPLAEFAYNASVHRSTGEVPFEADLGYIPRLPLDAVTDVITVKDASASTLKGREFAERLTRLLHSVKDELREAQEVQTAAANKDRYRLTQS
jgi:hypothetical protein